jgi:hypothetical protein
MVGSATSFTRLCAIILRLTVLQSTFQERIWDAAKAGDKARLEQCLAGATCGDFKFVKKEVSKSCSCYSTFILLSLSP